MADNWRRDSTRQAKAALIDTTVPNAARVGDYLHGGRNNFEADRRAVRAVVAAAPAIGTILPATRAFHQRAVRYLVAEAGIRQFLDIGTTLQLTGNTHEIAQSLAPECRVVYVDNDPMVLGHARALLTSAGDGAVASLDAHLMDPRTIRSRAQLTVLLEGLNLVPPGLVPVTEWHPAPDDPRFDHAVPVYGVVARKP
jgi:S-adenosyl methyltransferase